MTSYYLLQGIKFRELRKQNYEYLVTEDNETYKNNR